MYKVNVTFPIYLLLQFITEISDVIEKVMYATRCEISILRTSISRALSKKLLFCNLPHK